MTHSTGHLHSPEEPPSPGHGHHGGMAHDMPDPAMAKAMERDIRTRFFVALALTIPTILVSPMAMQMFGLMLVPMDVANWLALAFASPVVWWAGWIFIS